jgi:hypothetical protein
MGASLINFLGGFIINTIKTEFEVSGIYQNSNPLVFIDNFYEEK